MLIIFDLDGTLLNTIDDLGEACNHALCAFGFPMHAIEEYPRLVGNGVNKLILRALPEAYRDEELVLRLREVFIPYYNTHNRVHTRPYEGIPELLRSLREAGHQLAVASNKYHEATSAIVEHYFPGLFDVVLGEREGVERKPNPQIVYDICEALDIHVTDHQILYIGDSLVDIETARNASLPVIACSWGFVQQESLMAAQPDFLAQRPADILSIISTKIVH